MAWADRAILARSIKHEAETDKLLEAAPGWQVRRRRRLRRELVEAGRGRQAAERCVPAAAGRLAAIHAREAERAEWQAEPRSARC